MGKHSVERYGQKEVESWYWEVWNEPNGHYWKGTEEEFFKLYDYAADGLKKHCPQRGLWNQYSWYFWHGCVKMDK